MENWLDIARMSAKGVFWILVPVLTVLFRIKNKINTGFTVGIILLSFIIGLITTASIYEDPMDRFQRVINKNDKVEAAKALKVIIQQGPEAVKEIDEKSIVYKKMYGEIKSELIKEYTAIAERYYNTYEVTETSNCDKFKKEDKNLASLKHAMRLIGYSESIGGRHKELKKNLKQKITVSEKKFNILSEKCD